MKAGTMLATLVAISLCHGLPATAQTSHGGHEKKVTVKEPWARASVGRNGAAFLTVTNTGSSDDRLVAAKSDVSPRVALHTTIMEGNVMKMRQLDAVPVPAGETVMLKPGGTHIMLVGLEKKLVEGESFPLTLVFEKAGEISVTVPIRKIGAMGGGHGSMDHGGMKH